MISPRHIAAFGLALFVVIGASAPCAASQKSLAKPTSVRKDSSNTQFIELTDDKGYGKATAWPGQIVTLRPRNTKLKVIGWISETPEIAVVKSARGGVVEFLRPGVAIFQIEVVEVFSNSVPAQGTADEGQKEDADETNYRIVNYTACVEVKGIDLVIETSPASLDVFPGQTKLLSARVVFPLSSEQKQIDSLKLAVAKKREADKILSSQHEELSASEKAKYSSFVAAGTEAQAKLDEIKKSLIDEKGALAKDSAISLDEVSISNDLAGLVAGVKNLEQDVQIAEKRRNTLKASLLKTLSMSNDNNKIISELTKRISVAEEKVENAKADLDTKREELRSAKRFKDIIELLNRIEDPSDSSRIRQYPQQSRPIKLSLDDQDKLQLSKDGKTWDSTVTVMPNEEVIVRGVSKGSQVLRLDSAGLHQDLNVSCYVPKIAYKHIPSKLVQGEHVEVAVNLKLPDSVQLDDFIISSEYQGLDKVVQLGPALTLSPMTQNPIKLITTVKYKPTGEALSAEGGEIEIPVLPVVSKVSVSQMRSQIVLGDKIAVEFNLWDMNGNPVKWKDRGDIIVKISGDDSRKPEYQMDEPQKGSPLARFTEDDEKGYLEFFNIKPNKRYAVTFSFLPHVVNRDHFEPQAFLSEYVVNDIGFVKPLEIEARMIGDSRHSKDLFSAQVVKEFEVFELHMRSNLALAESEKYTQVSEIQVNGDTLLIPVTIRKNSNKSAIRKDTNSIASLREDPEVNGEQQPKVIVESTLEEIADFVRGNGSKDQITVYLPAVGKEELESVMDAIQDREPGNSLAHIVNIIDGILSVMNTVFPEYIPWLYRSDRDHGSADTISRSDKRKSIAGDESNARKIIVEFLNLQFAEYRNRITRRSDIAKGKLLSSQQKLGKDKDAKVYFLFPKDAWRSLCKRANLSIEFYPVCNAKVAYDFLVGSAESKKSLQPQQ